nr:hypothetical protein [Elizabethkingia sp. ASV34]
MHQEATKKNWKYYLKYIWNHKITILSYFASIYLIFFTVYSFNNGLKEYLKDYENVIKYFSQVSILIFTSGVFAASLKYLQLLEIFKEQFNQYIESSKFDEKIKNNLKLITFSDDYLLQQGNLSTLWKQITLCMYKKEFPSLYDKISKKIRNDFFIKSNISYYYKNFQISYYLEKNCNKSIKITERSSYTIVRPTKDEFEWDFGYKGSVKDEYKKDINFKANITTTSTSIEANFDNAEEFDEYFTIKIKSKLSGYTEYHIERHITIIQNIEVDRIRVFGSDRIIDDLSFIVKSDSNVNTTVHFIGNNKFYHNGAYDENVKAYINRDVFLPGQKFLLIFTLN